MTTDPVIQSRVFRHHRILCLEWNPYQHAIELLANAATEFGPASAVVGIANGGLHPARAIGEQLHVPHYRVNAKHNPTDATYTQATGQVTCGLSPLAAALDGHYLDGNVLIVDDICGSGATFTALLPALAPHLAPDAVTRTIVLCRNVGAAFHPDLWAWTVDDWVCFPWETPPPPGARTEKLPAPHEVRAA